MNQSLTFVIFGAEPAALKELSGVLATNARVQLLASIDQVRQAHPEIVRLRPSAAIIILGAAPEQELALIKQVAAECPETMIIGAAHGTSPESILSSLRVGAHEFLRLPIIAAEFESILDRADDFRSGRKSAPARQGRVISVFSNKGGCGTSFIAANLALALESPTAIVDLNLQAGDLGFFYHLESKFSIANLIENLPRADEAMLTSLLAQYSPSLSLLPGPCDVESAVGIKAGEVSQVIDLLRKRYDYVVIDLAHFFDEVSLTALDQSDDILLVITLDIMTIRSAQRALTVFDRLDYPREKIQVVVNRWDKKMLNLDWKQIERFLGKCNTSFVPEDQRAVLNSINLGKPLIESLPSSSVAAEIRRLASSLVVKSRESIPAANERAWLPISLDTIATGNGTPGTLNGKTEIHQLGSTAADAKSWTTKILSVFGRN